MAKQINFEERQLIELWLCSRMSLYLMQKLYIPLPTIYILYTLQQASFEAYIVGGAVRDLLLISSNPEIKEKERNTISSTRYNFDFDFATNAEPEDIQQLFPESFYENDFGTVAISFEHLLDQMITEFPQISQMKDEVIQKSTPVIRSDRVIDVANAKKIHQSLKNKTKNQTKPHTESTNQSQHITITTQFPNFEITTYRSKELYSNFRKPDSLEWGKSIEQDLERRDFTINALALRINQSLLQSFLSDPEVPFLKTVTQYDLIDTFKGLHDLNTGIVKAVGTASTRFQEDALRMLRAIRFCVQLNMQIDDQTFEAILHNAHLIRHISWERIATEFLKILKSNYPAEGIELLDQTKLLNYIMPELQKGKGVLQGGHHTTDVWTHSIDALRECPSKDPIVRLATLLHDIGKPQTYKRINGSITFYNHEVIGSRIAKKISRRLRLSKQNLNRIFILVRYHMFYYQPHNTDSAIRRFMRKVGLENIDDILDLREADRLGSGARRTSWRLEEMKQRMISQLNQPMDVTDLAINGHDLMDKLGIAPGPLFGTILSQLLEDVLENPKLNTKQTLLKKAALIIEKQNKE